MYTYMYLVGSKLFSTNFSTASFRSGKSRHTQLHTQGTEREGMGGGDYTIPQILVYNVAICRGTCIHLYVCMFVCMHMYMYIQLQLHQYYNSTDVYKSLL